MWQFTASLNWSVSRDGAQRSQESGPILSSLPSSTHFPTLHPSWPSHWHKGYQLISPDLHTLQGLSITLLDASVSHLCTLNTMPIPGHTICPVCYCCRFVHSSSPPPPSLTKRLTPGSLKLPQTPALVHRSCPRPPRSLAIFQDLSPVTSYTCKYNGLGDYWAINNNAGKVGKGVKQSLLEIVNIKIVLYI